LPLLLVLVWSGIVSSFYSLLEFGRSVGSSTTAGENTRLSAYGMYVFMFHVHTMYVCTSLKVKSNTTIVPIIIIDELLLSSSLYNYIYYIYVL
jgi:hypothetical protein